MSSIFFSFFTKKSFFDMEECLVYISLIYSRELHKLVDISLLMAQRFGYASAFNYSGFQKCSPKTAKTLKQYMWTNLRTKDIEKAYKDVQIFHCRDYVSNQRCLDRVTTIITPSISKLHVSMHLPTILFPSCFVRF